MKKAVFAIAMLVFSFAGSQHSHAQTLDQTPTGFYYPTGTNQLGTYAGWLAVPPVYFEGYYHIGWDIDADLADPVFAIAAGEVISVSENGWGTDNVGLLIRHSTADGADFVAIYGHLRSSLIATNKVAAGQQIGTIGPWGPTHLHFGIHPGSDLPPIPYGMIPGIPTAPYNGWVDPIHYITTHAPFLGYSATWVTQSIAPDVAYFPGQLVACQVRYRNSGTAIWHNNPVAYPDSYVELTSTDPSGKPAISFFNQPPDAPDPDVNWLTDRSPCTMQESSVAPGDTATFVFTGRINLNAPPGEHKIYFGPTHNGLVMPGWGEMHYPITVTSGWVASVPVNNCSGPVDGNHPWHQPSFLPKYNLWRPQSVPDAAGWGCDDCDRFYRYWYHYGGIEANLGASLHFRSDDAIAIYVNGHFVGNWGSGCHQSGCVNGPSNCYINYQAPDVDITSFLHKGSNLIAARVTERDGGEFFDLTVNEHPLLITEKAICCLGNSCIPITGTYTSANCQQDNGQVFIGGWFDCGTFSSCTNPQLKGKSDPVLTFTTPLPIADLPMQLTFTLDESSPRTAYYDLPEVLGGARLDVSDFTGHFVVLAQATSHPDTIGLTMIDYQFECPPVQLGNVSTGVTHVRLDSASTAQRYGKFVRSSRLVDIVVQTVMSNDLFTDADPVRSLSQIRGRFDMQTGVLESSSEAYNVLPSPCVTIACGDVNGSCQIDITDAVALIMYIFAGGAPPSDAQAGDVSCDGKCNISDAVYLVNYIFAAGPIPCAACP